MANIKKLQVGDKFKILDPEYTLTLDMCGKVDKPNQPTKNTMPEGITVTDVKPRSIEVEYTDHYPDSEHFKFINVRGRIYFQKNKNIQIEEL